MPARDYLAPPRPYFIQPETDVPLSPPVRPPFSHYHSSSTLPATPRTPYPATHMAQTPSQPVTSGTRLRPYLTLPPRLLLVFLTPAVLPLILTIAHLFQNRSSTASLAQSLKSGVLSACDGLAKGAASIQTMPRYLAMQTNQEVIRATQASILAIGTMLMDSVTIIETVVTYLVDTYRSMLLCTIELAVRGTLDALIGAVQLVRSASPMCALGSAETMLDLARCHRHTQHHQDGHPERRRYRQLGYPDCCRSHQRGSFLTIKSCILTVHDP